MQAWAAWLETLTCVGTCSQCPADPFTSAWRAGAVSTTAGRGGLNPHLWAAGSPPGPSTCTLAPPRMPHLLRPWRTRSTHPGFPGLATVRLRTCPRHKSLFVCIPPLQPLGSSPHPSLSRPGKGTPGGSPACCMPVTRPLSRAQQVSPWRPWPPAHPSGHVRQWPQTLNNSATHVFQSEEGPGILAPHPWAPRAPLPQCCGPHGTGHPAPGPGSPQQPGRPGRHCRAGQPPAPRGTVCRD